MKTSKLRSAHVTLRDDARVLIVYGLRVVNSDKNGARVLFAATRLAPVKERATVASVRALLGERAA